jgi:uncharacterized protein YceH (UPF0502 family)
MFRLDDADAPEQPWGPAGLRAPLPRNQETTTDMSDFRNSTPGAAPRSLDAMQRRVLGVLIEKAKTTPGGYPMTVNAIVTGSNQKSNRDPLTALDDADVMNTLNDLINLGVIEEIDWEGRVPKYKHLAYDWLSVSKVELAVLGELLLRGAQTLGELRARASRMEPIADLAALKPIVDGLVQRGLMIELTPPGRGQIVSHNLYSPEEMDEVRARASASGSAGAGAGVRGRAANEEIDELRAEIAELRRRVQDLEEKLGP